MHPLLSILLTFASMAGFVAALAIAADARARRRTRSTVLALILAATCLWGVVAGADSTKAALREVTDGQ